MKPVVRSGGATLTFSLEPCDPSQSQWCGCFSWWGAVGVGEWAAAAERTSIFSLAQAVFLKWGSRGFNGSPEDSRIAKFFLGSIQSPGLHLDWASAGLRCCRLGTWPGWSCTPVTRTLIVDGVLRICICLFKNLSIPHRPPLFDVRDVKSASTVQQIKCQPSFSIWC